MQPTRMIRSFLAALAIPATLLFVGGSPTVAAQSMPAHSSAANPGYLVINPPQQTDSGDKIEVIEVFSYGCIHCAHFQPFVDKWEKSYDKSAVKFSYLPATFNPFFKLMAQGYYAAKSLGVAERTHQQIFDALFERGVQIRTLDDLADLYASLHVDRDAFMNAAKSFFVETELARSDELSRTYHIEGTPTVVVAGKYSVTGESAGGYDKLFAVVDRLVAKERGAKP